MTQPHVFYDCQDKAPTHIYSEKALAIYKNCITLLYQFIYQYILINLIIMDYNNQPVAPLTFKEAVTRVFNKYAQFNGRASRAEFWWFMLFCVIVGFIFGILTSISSVFAYISYLFNLAVFIPVLAVSWRRLHDIDKAGGWWFINFVPLVGFIIFIIWCAKPGVPQANRFGEVPAN